MSRPSLGDRLVSGIVSAIFGAFVGCALAWLFGVYSNTLGAARAAIDFKQWALSSATAFGLIGLLLGSHAGTVVGAVISGIFKLEGAQERSSTWFAVVALAAAAFAVWLWLPR
jgi:hypothetical protein